MAIALPTDPERESPADRDRRELTAELLAMLARGLNWALRPAAFGGGDRSMDGLCLGLMMEPGGNGWQNRHTILAPDGEPRWTVYFERAHGVISLHGLSHGFRHVVHLRCSGFKARDVSVDTIWNAAPAPVPLPDTVLEHAHRRAKAEGRTLDLPSRRPSLLARLFGGW